MKICIESRVIYRGEVGHTARRRLAYLPMASQKALEKPVKHQEGCCTVNTKCVGWPGIADHQYQGGFSLSAIERQYVHVRPIPGWSAVELEEGPKSYAEEGKSHSPINVFSLALSRLTLGNDGG